jgi:CspA family cold shock protein
MNGSVKWFNELKRFGFIIHEGKDVFLHKNNTQDRSYTPKEGDKVEFEIQVGNKGPIAVNVKKAI